MKNNNYSLSGMFLKLNQLLWKKSFLQKFREVFYYIDSLLLIKTGKKKEQSSRKKKVLVVYNMALGDGIMFMGVAEHLREIYSNEEYELTIACQSAFKDLYKSADIFDKILPFDFSGSVVNLKKRRLLFKQLRQETYDILIDPIGCENCTMNIFVSRAAFARHKIGVLDTTLPNQCPSKMRKKIYHELVELNTKKRHLIGFYADFLNALGAKDCMPHPAILKEVSLNIELPEKFFIVFPTASMAVKRWPAERFAKVAQKIHKKTNMPLVVCGTKHDELVINEFLSFLSNVPVVNVIGQTGIMEFIEVIGKSSLILTNDTSAYHIGVAKQVTTTLVCGGYTYDRYAHYMYEKDGFKDPILVSENMPCFNCDNHCIYNNKEKFPCIENISAEKVWEAIEKVIDKGEV